MAISDLILPKLYALAKRNAAFKVVAKRGYKWLSDFRVFVCNFGKKKITYPPVLQFWNSSEEWVEQVANQELKPKFTRLSEGYQVVRKLPRSVAGKPHWKYRDRQVMEIPETYLLKIPNGRVTGQGFVITPQNELLGDVSKVIFRADYAKEYNDHPQLNAKLPPVEVIEGRVATISVPYAGTNYYHWMLDLLPRLDLIERGGVSLDSIDYFVINGYASRFQRDTLTHLGIGKDRILESQWHPHIQAEELIVPSLPGDTGQFPTWLCKWVQEMFLPKELKKPTRRLYLNRNKVSYRKVLNEAALEDFLAERGFESITLENLSVMEQAQLLSEAEAVVAPHGAGLTNIVFCQPETKIIELLHHSAVNEMYWVISNSIGLDYSYILTEGEHPEDFVDPYENFADLSFSLDSIKCLLDEIGLT